MSAINAGVGSAPSSRERANNIDRLSQSNNPPKAGNADIGKGRVQGLGPDGKVYVTTLVERASGGPGKMRYFANGKQLPPNITTPNAARAFVFQQIAKGALGQLALGNQDAFTPDAPPARVHIELGHRQPAECGVLRVARLAGLAASADGRVELPNNARGGQIFAQMQHTRWQRNSPQPMELIAKPRGASAPFIQGYKAQWSQMLQQQTPTTAAGNKREGNGLGWAPPPTQVARNRAPTDTALGADKAMQSARKAY
jgi:hypothetical protein